MGIRNVAALLLVAALLAAACAGDDEGTTTGESTTTASVEENDGTDPAVVDRGHRGHHQARVHHDRPRDAVRDGTRRHRSRGAINAEGACTRLTEDEQVFAVIGSFIGPNAEVNPCITETHGTMMIGGAPTPERLERATAPWLTTAMSAERRLVAAVNLMHEEGLIVEPLAIGVDIAEEPVADAIVIPELERLGYEITEKAVQDVPTGDAVAGTAVWGTFLERFNVAGINTVMFVESAINFGGNTIAANGFDGSDPVGRHRQPGGRDRHAGNEPA